MVLFNSVNFCFDETAPDTHYQAFMAAREYAKALRDLKLKDYSYDDPLKPTNWEENYDSESEVLSLYFAKEKLVVNICDIPLCLYKREQEELLVEAEKNGI